MTVTPESLRELAEKYDGVSTYGPLCDALREAAAALEAWDKMHHEVRDRLLASIDAERSLREQAQKSAVEIELECREAWKQAAHWRSLAEQAERTIAALREQLAVAEKERDEARKRFNDIDLCQHSQAPCEYALILIDERDDWKNRYIGYCNAHSTLLERAEAAEAAEAALAEMERGNRYSAPPFSRGDDDKS